MEGLGAEILMRGTPEEQWVPRVAVLLVGGLGWRDFLVVLFTLAGGMMAEEWSSEGWKLVGQEKKIVG